MTTTIKKTEVKAIQDALQESESKYRSLFINIANGIFIYHPETKMILDTNPAMTALYGYSHEEFVEMNCLELSNETEESTKASDVIEKSGKLYVKNRWHKKKDSTVFPLELEAFSVILDGRPFNYVVVKDITERKQKEQQVAEQLDELQRWHEVVISRESRVIELKREVNALLIKAGQPPLYDSVLDGELETENVER